MSIEDLRRGWPMALLAGRYQVVHREPGNVIRDVLDLLDIADTPAWIYEVVVDEGVFFRGKDSDRLWTAARPRTCFLEIRHRVVPRPPPAPARPLWRRVKDFFAIGDTIYDIADPRLRTWVGTVVKRGRDTPGPRWLLFDAVGQPAATTLESGARTELLGVGGVSVAMIWRSTQRRGKALTVDVSGLADRVDPRLVLACAMLMI